MVFGSQYHIISPRGFKQLCPLVRLEMFRLEIPCKILVLKTRSVHPVVILPEKLSGSAIVIDPPPVPLGIFGIYPDIGAGRRPGRD